MKKDVLIVKNISREGPGILEGLLAERGISYNLVDLQQGEPFPEPDGYRAVVVCGGPDSANDTNEKITAELQRVRSVLDLGIPYLGICLGLQVVVKAAGGNVVAGVNREIGFIDPTGTRYAVDLTAAGKQDVLFAGMSEDSFNVFQLHGETVELTADMQLLATGKYCQNQIVRVGKYAYGIQSHFELTDSMLRVWAEQDPDLRPLGSENLLTEFDRQREMYTTIGQTLFGNFLNSAGLA